MKGEFVVSSFCRGGECTVQVKHNTIVVIVAGKNNGRLPFGLLIKGIVKVFVKEYPPVYTFQQFTFYKPRLWWLRKKSMRKIRRAILGSTRLGLWLARTITVRKILKLFRGYGVPAKVLSDSKKQINQILQELN